MDKKGGRSCNEAKEEGETLHPSLVTLKQENELLREKLLLISLVNQFYSAYVKLLPAREDKSSVQSEDCIILSDSSDEEP